MSLLFWAVTGHAYDLTLGWDPNSEADLQGYVLYLSIGDNDAYRMEQTIFLDAVDPDRPRVMVADLDADIPYYFVVTAFNTDGLESGYSNELCVENGKICAGGGNGSTGNGNGSSSSSNGNGGCFAEALWQEIP